LPGAGQAINNDLDINKFLLEDDMEDDINQFIIKDNILYIKEVE
jgi:hypothetical protein